MDKPQRRRLLAGLAPSSAPAPPSSTRDRFHQGARAPIVQHQRASRRLILRRAPLVAGADPECTCLGFLYLQLGSSVLLWNSCLQVAALVIRMTRSLSLELGTENQLGTGSPWKLARGRRRVS